MTPSRIILIARYIFNKLHKIYIGVALPSTLLLLFTCRSIYGTICKKNSYRYPFTI